MSETPSELVSLKFFKDSCLEEHHCHQAQPLLPFITTAAIISITIPIIQVGDLLLHLHAENSHGFACFGVFLCAYFVSQALSSGFNLIRLRNYC